MWMEGAGAEDAGHAVAGASRRRAQAVFLIVPTSRLPVVSSIMSDVDELNALIAAGRLLFDPPNGDLLRGELLGIPPARPVHARVRTLVVALCGKVPGKKIRIASLIRNDKKHHGEARAVDVGNEEIARDLLPLVATQAEVDRLHIDELIFDAALVGESNRNKFNFRGGKPHKYDDATLADHRNHIHWSVRA
ncbi:hypothetical protein WMF26_31070 [Sorangium sp. So ce185]|uniref:hypothetical protein n=1 Tax=Sorangium sp. So ce185 TaxID=3133287 RepID=UPI003F5E439D